jgi:hypothetical protein
MLNYELVRMIQLERERDVERSVRARSLRAAVVAREVSQEPDAVRAAPPARRSTVVPARFR